MLPVAIIAGGLGTRLHPITQSVPKSLVAVGGEPFVDHQLRLLAELGVGRVVICVGHLGEMIEEHVADGAALGLEVAYSYDGGIRLGTGGALAKAAPLLGDAFLTLYGDSYLRCDMRAIEATFLAAGKPALMTVYRNEGRLAPSNVLFVDGQIVAYNKRNPSAVMKHIEYGINVFRSDVFAGVPSDTPTDLGDIFTRLIVRGDVAGYESPTRFYEVGSPEGIAETERVLPRSLR